MHSNEKEQEKAVEAVHPSEQPAKPQIEQQSPQIPEKPIEEIKEVQSTTNDLKKKNPAFKALMKDLEFKLKLNNYDIETLKDNEDYKKLIPKNKSKLLMYCELDPLFQKGKIHMKSQGHMLYQDLKDQTGYQNLAQYPPYKKAVKNEKDRIEKKLNPNSTCSWSNYARSTVDAGEKQNYAFDVPDSNLKKQDSNIVTSLRKSLKDEEELTETRNNEVAIFKWQKLMDKCKGADFVKRTQYLQDFYNEDHSGFIEQLKRLAFESPVKDLFSSLIWISRKIKINERYSSLLTHACAFYGTEHIESQDKERLRVCMPLIIQGISKSELHMETLGLLKFLMVNNIHLNEKDSQLLTQHLDQTPTVWGLFRQFAISKPCLIRQEIFNLIPRTGYIFYGSFNSLLKKDNGALFAHVDLFCRQKVIELCIYSGSDFSSAVIDFIKDMGDLTLKHYYDLVNSDFNELLNIISTELQKRTSIFLNKLPELYNKLEEAVNSYVNKKINNFDEIKDFTKGDDQKLVESFQQPVILQQQNEEDEKRLVKEFKDLNLSNLNVQSFFMGPTNQVVSQNIADIEKSLNRSFHYTQKICLFYSMTALKQRFQFFNFGVGTGKSLLCFALALLLTKSDIKRVIILNKSSYLAFRDFNKFKELIKKQNVKCLHNSHSGTGIFYWDKNKFVSASKQATMEEMIDDTYLIVDEYDSLFFEFNQRKDNFDMIEKVREFNHVFGFSGTNLKRIDHEILKHAFKTEETKFPQMRNLLQPQLIRKHDYAIVDRKQWKKELIHQAQIMSGVVPCLIISNQDDYAKLRSGFIKGGFIDLEEIYMKKNYPKLTRMIEKSFYKKHEEEKYGVYFMTEHLGRGTDFPSCQDIEDQGGIQLFIASVFDSITHEQVQGRVGRLQFKGQVQQIVCTFNDLTTNGFIKNTQATLDMNLEQKKENLSNLIQNDLDELSCYTYTTNQSPSDYSNNMNEESKSDGNVSINKDVDMIKPTIVKKNKDIEEEKKEMNPKKEDEKQQFADIKKALQSNEIKQALQKKDIIQAKEVIKPKVEEKAIVVTTSQVTPMIVDKETPTPTTAGEKKDEKTNLTNLGKRITRSNKPKGLELFEPNMKARTKVIAMGRGLQRGINLKAHHGNRN